MSCIRFSIVALLAVLVSPWFAAGEDQVYRKGAKTEAGVIKNMTKTEVTIAVNSVDIVIPANEITRISCEGESSQMSDVRNNVIQSNFKAAADDLKQIKLKADDRDIARQEVEFYRAFCAAKLAMTEGGDKAAAEGGLTDFVKKYKDSFHFYTVAMLAGDVAASAGNFVKAASYYTAVEKSPWPESSLRARVELGRMLLAQEKFEEALGKFEAVVNDPAKTAETTPLKEMAKVGQATCLGGSGKTAEAIKMLTGEGGIISNADLKNTALMARAYNALGTAHFKAGQKKEAKLAFMHTDLLFFADSDAHAEALYYLIKLFNEEKKADRATAAATTLKARYPGSVWANK